MNGKLYLASEEGDVIVVKMGEKYEVLATNSMPDQMFIATPAVAEEACTSEPGYASTVFARSEALFALWFLAGQTCGVFMYALFVHALET